jgi:co-chaperonin GroES (HSP10)
MVKRLILVLAVVAFAAGAAIAAPITGKVTSVKNNVVTLAVEGAMADWATKGATVKIKGGKGKIVDVGEKSVTISTTKAPQMKVGETISFDKGRVATGC